MALVKIGRVKMKRTRLLNKKKRYHYNVYYKISKVSDGVATQYHHGACTMSDTKRWRHLNYEKMSKLIKADYFNKPEYSDWELTILGVNRL